MLLRNSKGLMQLLVGWLVESSTLNPGASGLSSIRIFMLCTGAKHFILMLSTGNHFHSDVFSHAC